MVVTDDGCRLWTARSGRGDPLVLCHGGPGFWDTFGDLAVLLGDVATVHRWDQRGCGRSERRGPYTVARSLADRLGDLERWRRLRQRSPRSPDEERELAVLRLSADFADRDRALEHAERETTPFPLERALPAARRVVLDAAHLPWVEAPAAAFRAAVTGFLSAAR
jgi:pimeloyl-ACP methyl ester carboxylesterase